MLLVPKLWDSDMTFSEFESSDQSCRNLIKKSYRRKSSSTGSKSSSKKNHHHSTERRSRISEDKVSHTVNSPPPPPPVFQTTYTQQFEPITLPMESPPSRLRPAISSLPPNKSKEREPDVEMAIREHYLPFGHIPGYHILDSDYVISAAELNANIIKNEQYQHYYFQYSEYNTRKREQLLRDIDRHDYYVLTSRTFYPHGQRLVYEPLVLPNFAEIAYRRQQAARKLYRLRRSLPRNFYPPNWDLESHGFAVTRSKRRKRSSSSLSIQSTSSDDDVRYCPLLQYQGNESTGNDQEWSDE